MILLRMTHTSGFSQVAVASRPARTTPKVKLMPLMTLRSDGGKAIVSISARISLTSSSLMPATGTGEGESDVDVDPVLPNGTATGSITALPLPSPLPSPVLPNGTATGSCRGSGGPEFVPVLPNGTATGTNSGPGGETVSSSDSPSP